LALDEAPKRTVDAVIVGTGAGALVAALTGRANGLEVLVIEKADVIGGTSAVSGGGIWAPNAPTLLEAGVRDDPAAILGYMQALAGDVVAEARLRRYVEEIPRMMAFLEQQSEHLGAEAFEWAKGYSDYRPDLGGTADGHSLFPKPIDRRLLGPDAGIVRTSSPFAAARLRAVQKLPFGTWISRRDMHDLVMFRWGGVSHKLVLGRLVWRGLRTRLSRAQVATFGNSLIIRLFLACRERGVETWRETSLRELVTDDDRRVVGVVAMRDGNPIVIGARRGVILACGGFDHNPELRRRYHPGGSDRWSAGSPDNVGDGLVAAQAVGAAVDLMDEAWWHTSVVFPDNSLFPAVSERQQPGHFMVNQAGKRFVNEACNYSDFVHAQLSGHRTGVSHIPAWMIFDHQAWRRNFILGHFPGTPTPREWLRSGMLRRADTLEALAEQIGVPGDALHETACRFNAFARQGHDDDFNRGDSVYDRFYGDPRFPNPCLAPVIKPPFYALAFIAGDLGTNGGLLTDENARVDHRWPVCVRQRRRDRNGSWLRRRWRHAQPRYDVRLCRRQPYSKQ
jgi:3-oxosteroid 1-dehydrogenase